MKKFFLIFFLFVEISCAEEKCRAYEFEYEKQHFSVCSPKTRKPVVYFLNSVRIYHYGAVLYVVGSPSNVESFFKGSSFKLTKGDVNERTSICEWKRNGLMATNFEYIKNELFLQNSIPDDIKYDSTDVVFSEAPQKKKIQKEEARKKIIPSY